MTLQEALRLADEYFAQLMNQEYLKESSVKVMKGQYRILLRALAEESLITSERINFILLAQDAEALVDKLNGKKAQKLKEGTLRMYKQTLKKVSQDISTWIQNGRQQQSGSTKGKSKTSINIRHNNPREMRNSLLKLSEAKGWRKVNFEIRPNEFVELTIPQDVSRSETTRLCKFLDSLCFE